MLRMKLFVITALLLGPAAAARAADGSAGDGAAAGDGATSDAAPDAATDASITDGAARDGFASEHPQGDRPPPPSVTGCHCSAGTRSNNLAFLLMAPALLLARRRRHA